MTELPTRQAVVFELDRLAEYSDDSILAELRRVADIAPDGPLTTRVFQRYSRVSFGTVIQRFGSWDKALKAAGLNDRWLGSRAAKLAATKSLTDESIIAALISLASRLGKTELTWRDVARRVGAPPLRRGYPEKAMGICKSGIRGCRAFVNTSWASLFR